MQKVQKIYAVWTYVKDAEKSRSFYERVLGVQPRFQDGGWIEFDTGETTFAILERPKEKGALIPQKTRVMFQVGDIAAKENELKTQGIKIVNKMDEAYGVILTFEDHDGNWLEFYEPREYEATKS
jgi:predicted enzyme related to lactoylglutathione lyase